MVRRRQIGPCSMPGCGTPIYSGYLCEKHDIRRRRHGDPSITLRPRNSPEKPCAAPGCTGVTTRTYCPAHEWRLRTYGNVEMAPPRRRTFQGPCAEFGCGKVATKTGRCAHHSKEAEAGILGARPMLTIPDIEFIRQNRNLIRQRELADRLNTDVHTVIAVQAGRNWGRVRAKPKT